MGNLYSNLLEYVISSALIFYVLTVAGVFRLSRQEARYPASVSNARISMGTGFLHPCSHHHSVCSICYRPSTTWPGLLIVLLGIPIYLAISKGGRTQTLKSAPTTTADVQSAE